MFFIVGLFVLLFLLMSRLINNESKTWILINVNDIFSVGAYLIFFNNKRFMGMLLIFLSFVFYMLIIILTMPEMIIRPATLFRFIPVVYAIHQVFFIDKKIHCTRNGSGTRKGSS
jgi:hypothetical protein